MRNEIDLNRFPYYFNIENIEKEVNFWVYKNKPEKALEILENIEIQWLREKDEVFSLSSHPKFSHLADYNERSIELGLESLGPDESTTEFPDYFANRIHDLIEYTQEVINEGPLGINKPEKGENNSVKYFLLDHFFTGNSEFKSLKVKDQEKVLGYILACRADTAKFIKNNAAKAKPDGKYITQSALDRFTDLLERIKKGETL